jgi:hypothetical protein
MIGNVMERKNSGHWYSENPKYEVSDPGEPEIIQGETD